MKIVKSKVSILDQEPGIIGMYKHIERVGRVCYKSDDKITEDSWKKFVKMLYNRGHHAVFNLGTVYLCIPESRETKPLMETLEETRPFTKWNNVSGVFYVTTNFRVICQKGLLNEMNTFWSEPTSDHYHRVTADWVCSRAIAMEILRHRVLCPVMESTRYVNYSRDKFGSELTYILPQWIYRVREKIGNSLDPYTLMPRDYILDLDGEDLWKELVDKDKTVSRRDQFLKLAEEEYMSETNPTDEGEKLKAEEARGVLPQDVRCELCTCGYVSDWMYVNPEPEKDPEKAGFFYLRCAIDAHPDIRVLAESLREQFKETGIDKLK